MIFSSILKPLHPYFQSQFTPYTRISTPSHSNPCPGPHPTPETLRLLLLLDSRYRSQKVHEPCVDDTTETLTGYHFLDTTYSFYSCNFSVVGHPIQLLWPWNPNPSNPTPQNAQKLSYCRVNFVTHSNSSYSITMAVEPQRLEPQSPSRGRG